MKHRYWPAAALLFLVACDLNTPQNERNYAYFSLGVTPGDVPGQLLVAPSGVFFRAAFGTLLTDSRTITEGCLVEPRAINPSTPFDHINGGDSVIVSADLGGVVLKPVNLPGRVEYRPPGAQRISAAAGDTIEIVTVGGSGGFPPMTHKIAIVTPTTMSPVTIPAPGTPMDLTWSNPSNDEAVKVEITFDFMSNTGTPMRLLCILNDDGAAQIGAQFLSGMQQAEDPPMSANVLRYRSNILQSGANTLLAIVFHESMIDVTSAP